MGLEYYGSVFYGAYVPNDSVVGKLLDEYTERDYHKVTDEIKPDWDMSGGVEDLQLLLEVGWHVAEASQWPEWKPGSEFKARRDEALKAVR